MLEETRFELISFRSKTSDEQLQELTELITKTRGPLREQCDSVDGKKILYLGVRTWSQYFQEMGLKLFGMPELAQEREENTRQAIAQYVDPYLFVTRRPNGALPDQSHGAELLDKLYKRIYDAETSADYRSRKQDCEFAPPLMLDKRKLVATKCIRPAGCISVPKGLSVARIASGKITADLHILVNQKAGTIGLPEDGKPNDLGAEQERDRPPGNDPYSYCSQIPARESDNIRSSEQEGLGVPVKVDASGETPINWYWECLQNVAASKKTVVLEVASDHESHWVAAYTAAAEHIAARENSNIKVSVMLVPHCLEKDNSPNNESLLTDKEWLQKRADQLSFLKNFQELPNQSNINNVQTDRKANKKFNRDDGQFRQEGVEGQENPNPPVDATNLEFSDSSSDNDAQGSFFNKPLEYDCDSDSDSDGYSDGYTVIS